MISVIIVNHNGGEYIERCLSSLGDQSRPFEVLLVDNASSDGSQELVKANFPSVRILQQEENLGFAAANNLAAAVAEGDSLLLLNADAWLCDGALDLLALTLDSNPQLAMVAPRLRYPGGGLQFSWSPARGVVGEVLQRLRNSFENHSLVHGRLAWLAGRAAGRNWFTAACVLVRTAAFQEVGGFDERFFMYFEDVDLCVRLERAGWRLGEERRAVAHHAGGYARNADIDEIYRPSQLRYYHLHRPTWEASFVERRLRRRFGDAAVEHWLEPEAGG